jgi:thiol-disulfide isomerase/thioredoxin
MRSLTTIALLAVLIAPLAALDVGEKAPSLAKVTWMKGTAVEPGTVITVVEFWATWCGPCKTSIPHLTELQKKYGDKVNIVGISNEDQPTVKPFIEQMGAKMDYHVGIADVATYGSYMEGVDGIPHAFVVDTNGTVVWAGHPGTMEATLSAVVAGTFDGKKASAIGKAEGELQRLLQGRTPDIAKALAKIDEILAIDPVNSQAISVRLAIAKYQGNPALVRETLTRLPLKELPADLANSLAFARATEEDLASRHIDVAFTLIDHALSLEPDNGSFMDTKARLLAEIGLLDQAIALQQQAVAKAPDHDGLAATLAYYQTVKKLAASLSGGVAAPATAPATKPALVP